MSAIAETAVEQREVEAFLFREARLLDDHRYDDWEALWTDDAVYWVPVGPGDSDPDLHMSVIYDNRSRIATRIKQLHTGKRHSQTPPSNLRRLVSNVEVYGQEGEDALARANFIVFESTDRGTTLWAGRSEYRLRREGDELKLAYKKVTLVDNDRALNTLAFLI